MISISNVVSAVAMVARAVIGVVPSALSKLQGLFSLPDVSADQVDVAKRSFERHFEGEAGRLIHIMGTGGVAAFSNDVQSKFEAIVERVFSPLPGQSGGAMSGSAFATMMKSANQQATMALDRLRVDATRLQIMSNLKPVDVRPQITSDGPPIAVVRRAPQLENLVLRGGGAKGIGYSAALDQMQKAGVLSGLKHIAGSSAGAMTATCLAAGMSAAQFERNVADKLFRPGVFDALSGGGELERVYPDLELAGGLAPAFNSLQTLDRTVATNVHDYLRSQANEPEFQRALKAMPPAHAQRLVALQTLPDFAQPHKESMITFNDLRLLHNLAPEKFKLLTVTGWNQTDQCEAYFDADSAPDMPVAYAARISMAFPVVFKAVAMVDDGVKRVYADGGIGSNMPAEVFVQPGKANVPGRGAVDGVVAEQRARTLLMTFDEGGKAYQVMHGGEPQRKPDGWLGGIKAFFINLITRHPDQGSTSIQDQRKVWEAGPNALPVFHDKIGTLSMNVSDERQHQAHMMSAWNALEQIDARTQQAYQTTFDSLEALASTLTAEEVNALRTDPKPDHRQRQLLAIVDQSEVRRVSRSPAQGG